MNTLKILLLIFFTCISFIAPSFCMLDESVIEHSQVFNPFELIEKDDHLALQRMAKQLGNLGVNIMNIPIGIDGDSALHFAVRHGKIKCVKSLLAMRPVLENIEQINKRAETAYLLAQESNNSTIKELFLQKQVVERRTFARVQNLALHD